MRIDEPWQLLQLALTVAVEGFASSPLLLRTCTVAFGQSMVAAALRGSQKLPLVPL